jgi:hypothetical protein
MSTLAVHFNRHDTLRVEEVAGLLMLIAGAALFVGSITPMARRSGQIFGGLALLAAGLLFLLAVRYGVNP